MRRENWPAFFRAALPEALNLKLARGEGLFAVRLPCDTAADTGYYWTSESDTHRIFHLQPAWVEAIEAELPTSTHSRTRTLRALRGRKALPEDACLVEEAVACLALHQQADPLLKRLRQRAAVAMRATGGGGLYLASYILEEIE